MTDKRELILSRMEAILITSGIFDKVVRNDLVEDEDAGRIAMLYDGDEAPVPNTGEGRGRPNPAFPRPTHMHPELYILTNYALRRQYIGPWLTWAIKKVNFLFLRDAELLALLYGRDPIVYDGATTGLATGRSLAGEVSLGYTLTYVDEYADPGAEPGDPEDVTEPVTEPSTEPP